MHTWDLRSCIAMPKRLRTINLHVHVSTFEKFLVNFSLAVAIYALFKFYAMFMFRTIYIFATFYTRRYTLHAS